MLRQLDPGMFRGFGKLRLALSRLDLTTDERQGLIEHLQGGDCQPALVTSLTPLRVAVYSDEFDAVVMLKFPRYLVDQHDLKIKMPLVSINMYWDQDATVDGQIVPDITPGPGYMHRWANFHPVIADFVSTNQEQLDLHKARFSSRLLGRVWQLARQYTTQHPELARDGRPGRSQIPCDDERFGFG